jgi:hypothetical protein
MIIFHRFLIFTAICFCLGFAAWTFAGWRERGDVGALALAAAFAAAGLALGYYLKHLNRFLRR